MAENEMDLTMLLDEVTTQREELADEVARLRVQNLTLVSENADLRSEMSMGEYGTSGYGWDGKAGERAVDRARKMFKSRPAHGIIDFTTRHSVEGVSGAFVDVAVERMRQANRYGYAPEYDDTYVPGVLAAAGACYADAAFAAEPSKMSPPEGWPWGSATWNPRNDVRWNLVKAAALIVAEIERLDRAEKEV